MKLTTLAAGLLAAGFCGTVSAAPILALPLAGTFEDNNVEYVTDSAGVLKTTGQLEVGDTLWATVGFESIRNTNNTLFQNLGIGTGTEVTGISALRIESITGNTITFGADPTFEANWGTGALAAVFVDFAPDFDVGCTAGAPNDCTNTATNGTLWFTAGLGAATDTWQATTTTVGTDATLESLAALGPAEKIATANYGLSVLTNNTGYTFGMQACLISGGSAQICGSGDVLGGAGLGNGYIARSDFDFNFVRAVPVPGTAALLGLGFVAAGWASRRRAK